MQTIEIRYSGTLIGVISITDETGFPVVKRPKRKYGYTFTRVQDGRVVRGQVEHNSNEMCDVRLYNKILSEVAK